RLHAPWHAPCIVSRAARTTTVRPRNLRRPEGGNSGHEMTRTICLAAAILFAGVAQGAPAATSGQKCANLTEVALLARALAEAKVEKPRAHAVLRRMYTIPDEQSQS